MTNANEEMIRHMVMNSLRGFNVKFRNKYGKEAYDKRRGELSATTIINRVMPIISGWLAKEKQEVKTEFVRSVFTYVTSRAPKSGKFVIAK